MEKRIALKHLKTMFNSSKTSFDMFDFPGESVELLDRLYRDGLVHGSHRNGFTLSAKGAKLAAKS